MLSSFWNECTDCAGTPMNFLLKKIEDLCIKDLPDGLVILHLLGTWSTGAQSMVKIEVIFITGRAVKPAVSKFSNRILWNWFLCEMCKCSRGYYYVLKVQKQYHRGPSNSFVTSAGMWFLHGIQWGLHQCRADKWQKVRGEQFVTI